MMLLIIPLECKFWEGGILYFFLSLHISHFHVTIHSSAESGSGSNLREDLASCFFGSNSDHRYPSSQPSILDTPFGENTEARSLDHGGIISHRSSKHFFISSYTILAMARSNWPPTIMVNDFQPRFNLVLPIEERQKKDSTLCNMHSALTQRPMATFLKYDHNFV